MPNRPAHSYHLFLFPFQWDCLPRGKKKADIDFETRSNLIEVGRALLQNPLWQNNPYVIGEETDPSTDYNEFTFFYDFVRKTIFDYKDDNDKNHRLNYFSYQSKSGYFQITVKQGSNAEKKFKLGIRNISMHLFNTGVGILTFNLENMNHPDKDDVLLINEFGRRIYPQFLGPQFTETTKDVFLARNIEINFGDGKTSIIEDFSFYNKPENLKQQVFKLPAFISHLLEGTTFTELDKPYCNRVLISNIMDDRMFTMCWYGNDELANQFKPQYGTEDHYPYETNTWWYAFIFIDSNGNWPTCQNSKMLRKYNEDHTYPRWANYGTLYGVSRETFMLISTKDPPVPIQHHLRTMYFQIVVLCLVCRASILRFSGEVSRLTDLGHEWPGERNYLRPIEKLYENYIEFLNKIHFREVTAQIQGIEIYNLLYKHMNLNEQIRDLDNELEELHRFVMMRREKQRNNNAQILNYLAAFFLPMTVIAGFLGANIFDEPIAKLSDRLTSVFWQMVGTSVAISAFVIATVIVFNYINRKK